MQSKHSGPGHVLAAILSTPWMLCEAITCKKSSGDDTPGAGAFTVTFCACAPQFWPNCAVCMTDGLVVSQHRHAVSNATAVHAQTGAEQTHRRQSNSFTASVPVTWGVAAPLYVTRKVTSPRLGVRDSARDTARQAVVADPAAMLPTDNVSADTGLGAGTPCKPAMLKKGGTDTWTCTLDNAAAPVDARRMMTVKLLS